MHRQSLGLSNPHPFLRVSSGTLLYGLRPCALCNPTFLLLQTVLSLCVHLGTQKLHQTSSLSYDSSVSSSTLVFLFSYYFSTRRFSSPKPHRSSNVHLLRRSHLSHLTNFGVGLRVYGDLVRLPSQQSTSIQVESSSC